MRTGMLWIRCQCLSGISLSRSLFMCVCIHHTMLEETGSTSIKSQNLIRLHPEYTLPWKQSISSSDGLQKSKGCPLSRKKLNVTILYTLAYVWRSQVSLLFFEGGGFKRLRSANVTALWSVQNHFLNEWPHRARTALSIFVLYSISSSSTIGIMAGKNLQFC